MESVWNDKRETLDGLGAAASGANADITSMTALTQITRATGGAFDITIGGAAGDDFTVDTDKLVVEGDTGNVGIGASTFGTNAAKILGLGNGTAPTTRPADMVQMWSQDYAAGDARLYILGEGTTNAIVLGGGKLLLPQVDEPATPTLAFGNGATGFYEHSSGAIRIANSGVNKWVITSTVFSAVGPASGARIVNENPSSTNPVFTFTADDDTGVSHSAADQLSLVAGGVEGVRIVEDTYIAMHLPETTTPTAIANYGAIYPKADNTLYFQDGAGVEHAISATEENYGEAYIYNNAVATVIETINTPIALRQISTGLNHNFTFDAGNTGAITAYADYSGTVAGTVKATDAGHGLVTGNFITIRGTTNYNGVFEVTRIDDNEFYFTDTWVADDGASDWDQGASLTYIGTATAVHSMAWQMSTAPAAACTIIFMVYKNTTPLTKSAAEQKFANNELNSTSSSCVCSLANGDVLWLTAQSDNTANITNKHGEFNLRRL